MWSFTIFNALELLTYQLCQFNLTPSSETPEIYTITPKKSRDRAGFLGRQAD